MFFTKLFLYYLKSGKINKQQNGLIKKNENGETLAMGMKRNENYNMP